MENRITQTSVKETVINGKHKSFFDYKFPIPESIKIKMEGADSNGGRKA